MNTERLRNAIKAQRAALTAGEILQTSQLIAQQMAQTEAFQQAQHIAYYLPVSGEADPTLLLTPRNCQSKLFYLPILKKGSETGLDFMKVTEETCFEDNCYGIPEPVCNSGNTDELIQPDQLDLVITPLVSFDEQHNRVGMGGGFYDRTFAFKNTQRNLNTRTKPLLIGYAYEFQRSPALSAEPWDVKLDGIVTERKFYF